MNGRKTRGTHNSQNERTPRQNTQPGRNQPEFTTQRSKTLRATGTSQSGQSQKKFGQPVDGQKSGHAARDSEFHGGRLRPVQGTFAVVSRNSKRLLFADICVLGQEKSNPQKVDRAWENLEPREQKPFADFVWVSARILEQVEPVLGTLLRRFLGNRFLSR